MKRLLTIGHSYVVAANRRLADALARQGAGHWDITVVAPERFRGDLRIVDLEPIADEAATLQTARIRWQRIPHLMAYADLAHVTRGSWDVVHCWEEPYVRAGAQVAAAAPPRAIFVPATFQNLPKRYPWPLSAFERRTMARADGWIAHGETIRTALAPRAGYASRPCRVIPPGVDVKRFAPDCAAARDVRARLGWDETRPVVGFVGRFVDSKGVRVLCDVLERLRTPCRALFVGGGSLEAELRAFAARRGSDVAVVTGVRHEEVPTWLNAMTVLCAPSQTTPRWREQFGRMLIEAMACGVPVVASDSGEIPHVVEDAGTVVPERDVTAWVDAIDRLLADEPARGSLAKKGLARARERFSWESVARQHLEFFDDLLEQRR